MAMQRPRIERRTRSGQGVEIMRARSKNAFLKVGVLSGTGEHPNSTGGQTVAEVAWWNEFGTIHVDARPFLRTGLRENLSTYRRMIRSFLLAMLRGTMGKDQAIGLLGVRAVSDIQNKMTALGVIDSGQTRQHINWARVS
jgi:hypothetical protein